MGGKTPRAPVQSNEGQYLVAQQMARQNDLLYKQSQETAMQQQEADNANAERLREIEIRDAEAKAEAEDREARAKKGKRDLLYRNAVGVQDEEDSNMLLLGGA